MYAAKKNQNKPGFTKIQNGTSNRPHSLSCLERGCSLFYIRFFARGRVFDWAAMENSSDWATTDYFRHVYFALDRNSLYDHSDASFPPRVHILLPRGIITCKNAVPDSMFGMTEMPYQLALFLLYNAFGICIWVYAVGLLRLDPARRRLLTLGLILSMPFFLGALERGNSAFYVTGLFAIAMQWRESESKRKQEAALLLIAVSTRLKVYPCFLGILYLKERRWREAERLVIYGIVLFFAPFLFFGGISGLIRYFGILRSISSQDYPFRVQFLKGLLGAIGITETGAAICNYVFLMCLLGPAFLSRSKTRTFVFLAAAMALFPGAAYRYTLLYFALPLLADVQLGLENRKLGFWLNAFFFGAIFSIPTLFGILTDFETRSAGLTTAEIFVYAFVWIFLIHSMALEEAKIFTGIKKKAGTQP